MDGAMLAQKVRAEVASDVAVLRARGVVAGPHGGARRRRSGERRLRRRQGEGVLAKPAWLAKRSGFRPRRRRPSSLALVEQLNADVTVHGILVQMPLPKQIDPIRSSTTSGRRRTWTASIR
jgi:methylenetetrahydrofolate dehydrogenase (NADP+)/methenyltetrahydrofolate cyclohydrolase